MSTVSRARWPFVGRQTEMDSVLGLLDEGSSGVLIYGDAGVGKSALARAVLAELSSRERPARVVRLPTDAAVAVTPWTVFAPMLVSAAPVVSLDEVLARVRHDLEGSGPVLLHVDDVHLLDDPSATLLAELVQSEAVTVLATTRHHPGPAAPLVALWREGTLDRLDLSPLDHLAVAGVLTHVLDGPVAQETTKRIWEATNGKPLYLRELVLALVESEALQLIEGAWLWDSASGPSRRLVDLVGYELAGLCYQDREAIELVALAGSIQVERIGAAVSDHALERVIRSGLVEVDTEPSTGIARARITHPVYAETVRSLIYPQRRRTLFHRLSAPARQSTDLAELFHWVSWALQCGIEPDADSLLAATRAAASVQSTTLAIRMATEALQRLDQDAAIVTEILLLRAEAFRFEGAIQRAQQDLEAAGRQLHELRPDPNHDHLWVRWAEVTADLQQYHHDDLDGALHTLSRVQEHRAIATDAARHRLSIARLSRLGYAGRFSECVDDIRQWRTGPAAGHEASIQLIPVLALGLAQQGATAAAVQVCDEALTTWSPEHSAFPWVHGEILSARFLACLWSGDLHAAVTPPGSRRHSRARYDEAVSQTGTGHYYAALGQWSRAIREYRGALSRFAIRDPSGLAGVAWVGLARACAAIGATAQARAARDQYLARAAGTSRVVEADCRYGLVQVAVALGEAGAHQYALDFSEWCLPRGLHLSVLRGRHLALTTATEGDRAELLPDLIQVAGRVDGPVSVAMVDHARALVAGDREVAAFRIKELAELGVWVPISVSTTPLTARQHEIANLVVQGLSNREVAERLVLSVRTVDTHVGHIFTRLGVANRADLAGVLHAHAAPTGDSRRARSPK